jgi:N-acetylmuramic acid 6-phosphate etherase
MLLSNEKLLDRGVKMLMEKMEIKDYHEAKDLLVRHGSVKNAMESLTTAT